MTRILPTRRPSSLSQAIDGIRRRAGTVIDAHRRFGIPGVAVAVAGHLPKRLVRIEWYELLETLPPGEPGVPPWPDTRRAGLDDVDALAAVGQAAADDIRARLENGDRAYLASDAGAPVGYLWFRARRWREDDTEFVLGDDERWAYDSFVAPPHRGRRIAPAVTVHAMAELHRDGVHRVLSVIDLLNESSRRAARRYGSHAIGSFVTVALPGLLIVHERPAGSARASWSVHRRPGPIVRRPPASRGA